MKVIGIIEEEAVIKKILKHLRLWDRKARSPLEADGLPKVREYSIDYSTSQIPDLSEIACGESGSDKLRSLLFCSENRKFFYPHK